MQLNQLLSQWLPLAFLLLPTAEGGASQWEGCSREKCQAPTNDPLEGCPPNTILVGPGANYTTIQSAILSLPDDTSSQTVLILPGTYEEQVNVTRPGPVTLLGQTSSPEDVGANTVEVLWHAVAGTGDNAYTAVLTVAPNLNASLTGSGPTGFAVPADQPFGNTDFRAYNLNFTNDYLPYTAGPSLALSTGYSNSGFYHCSFASYQDTIYIGKNASTYISHSSIAGQTDFLYGFGTLWIANSTLLLRSCGGGITAWKGTNTTFENKYGVYIVGGSIVKANDSLSITHKCALGRPWNSQHRSIFAHNYMDDSILPAGYIDWSSSDRRVNNLTFMAEYEDFGPGFNLTARLQEGAGVTIELSASQWANYDTPEKVFQYEDGRFGNLRKPPIADIVIIRNFKQLLHKNPFSQPVRSSPYTVKAAVNSIALLTKSVTLLHAASLEPGSPTQQALAQVLWGTMAFARTFLYPTIQSQQGLFETKESALGPRHCRQVSAAKAYPGLL